MKRKVFVVADELCSGCRNCEMWCSFWRSGKKGFGPPHSKIRIIKDPMGELNSPVVDCDARGCRLSEQGDPVCVEMCPTGCLIFTDTDDLAMKRVELQEKRRDQPLFKLIAPWKYPYPWRRLVREEL